LNDTTNGAATTAQAAPAKSQGIYRNMVLLDRQRHAGKRVKPVNDWLFAGEVNAVPLTTIEFADVAREFPIGFIASAPDSNGKARVAPVVMLGLRERQNLVIGEDGRWNARSLPAVLRRYPFAYVRTQPDQISLVVDEAYEGLNDSEGELLITTAGEPTEYLQSVMHFLDRLEAEQQRTEALCERLVALNLLRSAEIKGELPNGEQINATGFFMVDEEKLAKLPDADVLALHRSGELALVHAHLVSMGQFNALAQRMGAL
jgi:SapC